MRHWHKWRVRFRGDAHDVAIPGPELRSVAAWSSPAILTLQLLLELLYLFAIIPSEATSETST